MAVEVYPHSQLASPGGLLAQLRTGTIDGVPLARIPPDPRPSD